MRLAKRNKSKHEQNRTTNEQGTVTKSHVEILIGLPEFITWLEAELLPAWRFNSTAAIVVTN
jgi:hypothetical protein